MDVTNSEDETVGMGGELFMAKAQAGGSVKDGYVVTGYNNTPVTYKYDADQVDLWGEDVLALATDTPVAKITSASDTTGTTYMNFDDALADWTDGTTLTLLDSVSYDSLIELEAGTRTFDVGEYTLTLTGDAAWLKNYGTLTIQGGTITASVPVSGATIENYGTLTINGTTINNHAEGYAVRNLWKLTAMGGTFTGGIGGLNNVHNPSSSDPSSAELNSTTLTSIENNGNATVTNCTFTREDPQVGLQGGTITFNFSDEKYAGLRALNYSGGTLSVGTDIILPQDYYLFDNANEIITTLADWNYGTIEYHEHEYTYTCNGNGTHTKACADGCGVGTETVACTLDTTNKCTVCHGQYVASITSDSSANIYIYTDFTEAVDAWKTNGGTMTLLANVSYDEAISLGNSSTYTFNGDKYTLDMNNKMMEVYSGATLNCEGGTLNGALAIHKGGILNATGGTIACDIQNSGTVTLAGSHVHVNAYYAIHNSGVLNISNGSTLKCYDYDIAAEIWNGANGTVTIENDINPEGWRIKNDTNAAMSLACLTLPIDYYVFKGDKIVTELAANEIGTIQEHTTHNPSISLNGTTYTALCSACDEPMGSATVNLPTDLVYNGRPKAASWTGSIQSVTTLPEITYEGDCTNVGTFIVKVEADGWPTFEEELIIAPADIADADVILESTEYTYDGNAKKPGVEVDLTISSGASSGGTEDNAASGGGFVGSDFSILLDGDTDYTLEYLNNTNAGTATVKVIGVNNFTGEVTANFTINKAMPTTMDFNFMPPANLYYDGTGKAATVTTDKVGMGEISITYSLEEGDSAAGVVPNEVGSYQVTISVTEGENYLSMNGLCDAAWTFEIKQSATSLTAEADKAAYTYGEAITVTGTAQAAGTAPVATFALRSVPVNHQVALFAANGTQLTEPVNVENGAYTLTYNTTGKDILPGESVTLTVKFVGDSNMADQTADVTIKLVAKSLTTTLTGSVSKVYDGNNAVADASGVQINMSGIITGDEVTVSAAGYTFEDANAGQNKNVTATGMALGGTDKAFYALTSTETSAQIGEITKADLPAVTKPADQKLTAHCADAATAIANLPAQVSFALADGSAVLLDVTWSCADYDATPKATNTFTWTVDDPAKLANYALAEGVPSTGTIIVTNSETLPVTVEGTDAPITYNGTTYDVKQLFSIDANAGAASYAIVSGGTGEGTLDGSILTITKAGTITVKVITSANGVYEAAEATAVLTISKADPVVTVPAGLTAEYGQKLSDIALPVVSDGVWAWADADALVGEAGAQAHQAIFTPTNVDLWNAVTLDVTVTVTKTEVIVGEAPVITAPAAKQEVAVLEGEQGTMTITATDATAYQWYINRNDGLGYVPISGATSASYTTSVVNMKNNGFTYYCVASNAYGETESPVFLLQVL